MAKKTTPAKAKGPKKAAAKRVSLPKQEALLPETRDAMLDKICDSIGDELATIASSQSAVVGLKQSAGSRMKALGRLHYSKGPVTVMVQPGVDTVVVKRDREKPAGQE